MKALFLIAVFSATAVSVTGQTAVGDYRRSLYVPKTESTGADPSRPIVESSVPKYYNQLDGISLSEIVQRSFSNNGEIKIARLEVDKARARLTQAGLRPNPTIEVEQSYGPLVRKPGERELSVGVSLPLDIYGQRSRRIEVANAELTLKEAELATAQRELSNKIFDSYIEALSSLREIQILEELLAIDIESVRFVQIRVNEGETPPLEVNLLQTEVERLRAQRQLAEGKLQSSVTKLKFYSGVPYEESLKLREEISTATLPSLPKTIEAGVGFGLKSRPEIRLAQLEEQLATAGLRLVRSQSKPDVTAYTRYMQGRSSFDDPRGEFFQGERSLTFGVAIGLPIFNKNQGAKAEAQIAIRQAQERRIFAEQVIRSEVISAFQRLDAANRAVSTLETAVIPRSRQNIEVVRKVYEIGELKITDLLAEQRRLLDANRDLTSTLTERYRAQLDLFIALGITLD